MASSAVLVAMCRCLTLQSVEMSPNRRQTDNNLITLELPRDILVVCGYELWNYLGREIIMQSYFFVILSVCVVLLSLHPGVVEMAPKARVERQSDDLLTIAISKDTVVGLLEALLGKDGLLGGLLG
ncbi:hypothetical protein NPIL_538941 [Nephila pilipes]|uniref:Uncharacterized protein n=1 Tax=Nephila pilipes TaxID=299642 RepID=A0A8X6NZC2_NEPPI|nr:hypothetical protein NPIL_538941 [Nephila pilipes]